MGEVGMVGVLQQRALDAAREQRNFVLFVLSNAEEGRETAHANWLRGAFRAAAEKTPLVKGVRVYEADPVDVTYGRFALVPAKYLACVDIAADFPEETGAVIDQIYALHAAETSSRDASAWLFYPSSEKFGLDLGDTPAKLCVHFMNGLPEEQFAYAEHIGTQLVRYAVRLAPLVNGQSFERCAFQKAGALAPNYQTMGLYELGGPTEQLVETFKSPPPGLPDFPGLHNESFTETVFVPLV